METWFRGEGVGVPAATPGSTAPHDLGDGMYLSDDVKVAGDYAALRSPSPAGRRVYAVDLDLRQYRVLDLTADARWQKFISPLAPGMPSAEKAIQEANENYGKTFANFIRRHNIDLRQYDVVVGREYLNGGRQLCVVFKDGRPSPLQAAVRMKFRVVTTPGALATRLPIGTLALRGKIGPGLRTVGAAVGVIAITALLSYLLGKLQQRYVENEMRKLEPKIVAEVYRQIADIAELLVTGRTPYANVTVEVTTFTFVNTPSAAGEYSDPLPTLPTYDLRQVAVSERNVASSNSARTLGLGFYKDTETLVYSLPLALTTEEVELYRAYRLEMQWYDEVMRSPLATEDLIRLDRERTALMARFDQALTRVPPP